MTRDHQKDNATGGVPRARKPMTRRKRWLLYILAGLAIIILLAVIVDAVVCWRGRSYAAARAREDLKWWRSLWTEVPDAENRFLAYRELTARLPDKHHVICHNTGYGLTRLPEFGDSWPAFDELMRRDIQEHAAELDDLLRATERPGYALPHETLGELGEGLLRSFPHAKAKGMSLEWLGKLLTWQAWLEIHEGRRAEGVRRLVAVARLGSDLATGMPSSMYAGGMALHKGVAMVVADAVRRDDWRPAELRDLARRLLDARLPPVWQAIHATRLAMLATVGRGEFAFAASMREDRTTWLARLVWRRFEAVSVEEYDRLMRDLAAALAAKDGRARAEVRKVTDEILNLDRERVRNWMSVLLIPSVAGIGSFTGSLQVATTALRMKAAFVADGRYPDSLSSLAALDGLGLPTGPYGEPLKTAHGDDGVIVYHTGYDGKDDGGWNRDRARNLMDPPQPRERDKKRNARARRAAWDRTRRGDDFGIELATGAAGEPASPGPD